MITLADLVRQFEPQFLARFGQQLRPEQRQALWAIKACHTPQCGQLQYECEHCHSEQARFRSCGHRFCPACQHHHNQQWLQRQQQKLLPCDYYLITFTLPAQLRGVCRQAQRIFFLCLFKAAVATLQQFATNDKQLGGQLGLTAVLHTHSRQLVYHPHIHVVVPGGTLQSHRWRSKSGRYLFEQRNLAKVFRAKFLSALKQQAMRLPVGIRPQWVAQCQHVGRGDKALLYLSRYLYRGVISEKNLSLSGDLVSYRYQNSQSKKMETLQLPAIEFLWRVMQHVLPKGFRRARDYGLLHPAAKAKRTQVRLQSRMPPPIEIEKTSFNIQPFCRCCGQAMGLRGVHRPKRAISPGI